MVSDIIGIQKCKAMTAFPCVHPVFSKCVSGTAVTLCASAQGNLESQGLSPNGEIACYSELAGVMNDFVYIMNGLFLERRGGVLLFFLFL